MLASWPPFSLIRIQNLRVRTPEVLSCYLVFILGASTQSRTYRLLEFHRSRTAPAPRQSQCEPMPMPRPGPPQGYASPATTKQRGDSWGTRTARNIATRKALFTVGADMKKLNCWVTIGMVSLRMISLICSGVAPVLSIAGAITFSKEGG